MYFPWLADGKYFASRVFGQRIWQADLAGMITIARFHHIVTSLPASVWSLFTTIVAVPERAGRDLLPECDHGGHGDPRPDQVWLGPSVSF